MTTPPFGRCPLSWLIHLSESKKCLVDGSVAVAVEMIKSVVFVFEIVLAHLLGDYYGIKVGKNSGT